MSKLHETMAQGCSVLFFDDDPPQGWRLLFSTQWSFAQITLVAQFSPCGSIDLENG